MKRRNPFAWVVLSCCLLAACLSACARGALPTGGTTEAPVVIELLPTVTPAPSPTPTLEPEMIIDEDGDITLRADIAASFTTAVYSLDHAPTVLIYHTHAAESYRKAASDTYVETEPGRTKDNGYNVVRIGDLLAEALEARGFTVLHDKSNVESPDLSGAYARSLAVMEQYGGVDLYIDLHRNASSQRGRSDNTISVGGTPCAKIFFVVGTGIGAYDGEYAEVPDWHENYTLALSVGEAIAANAAEPALVKPIRLKAGRYNQHMGMCLLAEIGTNADTLQAAENTVPYLADALQQVFSLDAPQ